MNPTLRQKLIDCGWVSEFNADTLVSLIERESPKPIQPTDSQLQEFIDLSRIAWIKHRSRVTKDEWELDLAKALFAQFGVARGVEERKTADYNRGKYWRDRNDPPKEGEPLVSVWDEYNLGVALFAGATILIGGYLVSHIS